jgi:hypothetical protein
MSTWMLHLSRRTNVESHPSTISLGKKREKEGESSDKAKWMSEEKTVSHRSMIHACMHGAFWANPFLQGGDGRSVTLLGKRLRTTINLVRTPGLQNHMHIWGWKFSGTTQGILSPLLHKLMFPTYSKKEWWKIERWSKVHKEKCFMVPHSAAT